MIFVGFLAKEQTICKREGTQGRSRHGIDGKPEDSHSRKDVAEYAKQGSISC